MDIEIVADNTSLDFSLPMADNDPCCFCLEQPSSYSREDTSQRYVSSLCFCSPPPCPSSYADDDERNGGSTPAKHLPMFNSTVLSPPSPDASPNSTASLLRNFQRRQSHFRQTLSPQLSAMGRKSLPPTQPSPPSAAQLPK